MGELVRQALRGRCCLLALQLQKGVLTVELLAEVEALARDAWALRSEDDA